MILISWISVGIHEGTITHNEGTFLKRKTLTLNNEAKVLRYVVLTFWLENAVFSRAGPARSYFVITLCHFYMCQLRRTSDKYHLLNNK